MSHYQSTPRSSAAQPRAAARRGLSLDRQSLQSVALRAEQVLADAWPKLEGAGAEQDAAVRLAAGAVGDGRDAAVGLAAVEIAHLADGRLHAALVPDRQLRQRALHPCRRRHA